MENDYLYVEDAYCECDSYEREIRKTIELAWDDDDNDDEMKDLVSI